MTTDRLLTVSPRHSRYRLAPRSFASSTVMLSLQVREIDAHTDYCICLKKCLRIVSARDKWIGITRVAQRTRPDKRRLEAGRPVQRRTCHLTSTHRRLYLCDNRARGANRARSWLWKQLLRERSMIYRSAEFRLRVCKNALSSRIYSPKLWMDMWSNWLCVPHSWNISDRSQWMRIFVCGQHNFTVWADLDIIDAISWRK